MKLLPRRLRTAVESSTGLEASAASISEADTRLTTSAEEAKTAPAAAMSDMDRNDLIGSFMMCTILPEKTRSAKVVK